MPLQKLQLICRILLEIFY